MHPERQRTRRDPGRGSTEGRPGGPAEPGPEPARSRAAARQIDPQQQPKAAHQVEGQTADQEAEASGPKAEPTALQIDTGKATADRRRSRSVSYKP